jgi:aspartyl-tRNA(Asn)/glutamyl-tRNA(Gln) amidotransferase subunit C
MMVELNGILGWIEQLQEVDVGDIEPMTSVITQKLKMRDDVVTAGGDAAAILVNAPQTEDGFIVVPKVLE